VERDRQPEHVPEQPAAQLEHHRLAEAPSIGEQEAPAAVQLEACPQIGGLRAVAIEQQVAGHAQMHGERQAPLQPEEQILPPPLHRVDPAAGQRPLHATRRNGARPAFVEDLRGDDPAAGDLGLQLAADRLHLGELGHARGSTTSPGKRASWPG
jgi:hypothetical protein